MRFRTNSFYCTGALLPLLLLIACTTDSVSNGTSTGEIVPTAGSAVNGSAKSATLIAIPGVSDVAAHEEVRIVFGLLDMDDRSVKAPQVDVTLFWISQSRQELQLKGNARADFREWPTGPKGLYTFSTTFDQMGDWILEIAIPDQDGLARLPLQVQEQSSTLPLGSSAPPTVQKTLKTVNRLDEISTDVQPDPDLYRLTIADALKEEKPLVIAFATPGLCQSFTCGPQLEAIKATKLEFGKRVNFIHVEIYDNPGEMKENVETARINPAVLEWRLPSEPWTFVVDTEGRLVSKFESFVSQDELRAALLRVVQ